MGPSWESPPSVLASYFFLWRFDLDGFINVLFRPQSNLLWPGSQLRLCLLPRNPSNNQPFHGACSTIMSAAADTLQQSAVSLDRGLKSHWRRHPRIPRMSPHTKTWTQYQSRRESIPSWPHHKSNIYPHPVQASSQHSEKHLLLHF